MLTAASFIIAVISLLVTIVSFMLGKNEENKKVRWGCGGFFLLITLVFSFVGIFALVTNSESTASQPKQTFIVVTATTSPQPAINPTKPQSAIQPSSFTVYASQAWNDTGLNVGAGDLVQVQYKSGTWTYWAGTIPASDARGNPNYVCAQIQPASKCLEPVPEAAAGSLIARIGDAKPFYIGNQSTFKAASAGMFQLGINDLDLSGNEGFVVVQITMTRNP